MAENSDFKNKHIKSIISNLDDIHKEIKDSIIRNDSESINFLTQLSEQYIASLFMIGRINNIKSIENQFPLLSKRYDRHS